MGRFNVRGRGLLFNAMVWLSQDAMVRYHKGLHEEGVAAGPESGPQQSFQQMFRVKTLGVPFSRFWEIHHSIWDIPQSGYSSSLLRSHLAPLVYLRSLAQAGMSQSTGSQGIYIYVYA